MSKQHYTSRREALYKHIRAQAHREQTTFHAAVENSAVDKFRGYKSVYLPRRTVTGRTDLAPGKEADLFVGPKGRFAVGKEISLSNGSEDVCECMLDLNGPTASRGDVKMTVAISDIARQAKGKGVAKDYEVIERVNGVIALNDEPATPSQWTDDWEDIFEDHRKPGRKSYSAVLRGNER